MIKFVIGGKGQGKLDYVLETEKLELKDIAFGEECNYDDIFHKKALYNFHLLVKRLIVDGIDPIEFMENIFEVKKDLIIISDEIGLGIVPMEKENRNWREITGRASCMIAKKANIVERVICGIPTIIKNEMPKKEHLKSSSKLKVVLIRHGKTEGNELKRYIGSTDEHLTLGSIHELLTKVSNDFYPEVDKVYVSTMARCIETAKIIYPRHIQNLSLDLRETDFGDFENKSYEDLKDNQDYQDWLNSNGSGTCPNGEDKKSFCLRCQNEFEKIINNSLGEESIALVVHGGTIMAILEKYAKPHKDFYNWQIRNAEAYVVSVNKNKWINEKEVIVEERLGGEA